MLDAKRDAVLSSLCNCQNEDELMLKLSFFGGGWASGCQSNTRGQGSRVGRLSGVFNSLRASDFETLRPISISLSHSGSKHTVIMDRLAIRRALQPQGLPRLSPAARHALIATPRTTRALSTVPRIAETSFWKSLIPKPWRRENRPVRDPMAPKQSWLSKEWNPATFFIIIFLLIGSMSIQMISLRKSFDTHTRRSAVRIGLLREVIEKLENGEQVDVENVLGSGDPEKEAVWEEGEFEVQARGKC